MADLHPAMAASMRRIDRILLAIQQAHPGRVETRAALLGAELGVDAFDVLAVKRAGGLRPSTACCHVRVERGRLHGPAGAAASMREAPAPIDELEDRWTVRRGHPSDAIAAAADSIGADLTLVAGSGRPRLPLWARPSQDADLVRAVRGALLLVHGQPRGVYRSVVVATDFSRASLAAARTAALLAPSARFVFVHAFRQPEQLVLRELELPQRVLRACGEQAWEAARAPRRVRVAVPARGAARPLRGARRTGARGDPRLRAAPRGRPAGAGQGSMPSGGAPVQRQRDAETDGRRRLRSLDRARARRRRRRAAPGGMNRIEAPLGATWRKAMKSNRRTPAGRDAALQARQRFETRGKRRIAKRLLVRNAQWRRMVAGGMAAGTALLASLLVLGEAAAMAI